MLSKMLPIVLVAGLVSTSFGVFAQSPDHQNGNGIAEIKNESRELLQAMKKYSEQQKTKAIASVDESLDRLDRRIDALDRQLAERWNDLSEQSRTELHKQMAALRKERLEVAEWFGSLKNSSKEAWHSLKNGFADSYKEMSAAWEQAEEAFADKP